MSFEKGGVASVGGCFCDNKLKEMESQKYCWHGNLYWKGVSVDTWQKQSSSRKNNPNILGSSTRFYWAHRGCRETV